MKKFVAFGLTVVMLLSLCGCLGAERREYAYSLENESVSDEKILDLSGKKVQVKLTVPQNGTLRIVAYDCSEYEVHSEKVPTVKVSLTDTEGRKASAQEAEYFLRDFSVETGDITVDIEFTDTPTGINQAALLWAFVPDDRDVPMPVRTDGKKAATLVPLDGTAQFSFSVEQDSLVSVACAEACWRESSCSFTVSDESGDIVSDVSIETTEWNSRRVFVPKGEYILTVTDIEAMVTVGITVEETYDNIKTDEYKGVAVQLPAKFGFTLQNSGKQWAEFTADGSNKTLYIEAKGIDSFYDSEQTILVEVFDKAGNAVISEPCEGSNNYDISGLSGEYVISLLPEGEPNAVVNLELK